MINSKRQKRFALIAKFKSEGKSSKEAYDLAQKELKANKNGQNKT